LEEESGTGWFRIPDLIRILSQYRFCARQGCKKLGNPPIRICYIGKGGWFYEPCIRELEMDGCSVNTKIRRILSYLFAKIVVFSLCVTLFAYFGAERFLPNHSFVNWLDKRDVTRLRDLVKQEPNTNCYEPHRKF
jgi:hypothetical protein